MSDLKSFENKGYFHLGAVVSPDESNNLLKTIKDMQYFGPDIILGEQQYREIESANSQVKGAIQNPNQTNLLDQCDLTFIENNPTIVETLSKVLGPDYNLYARRIICGIPKSWIGQWIIQEIKDKRALNFGGFVKPEYRNLRYFTGIDFHQDLIDFNDRIPDFITLYVYLEQVTSDNAPLIVLPGSHLAGADIYPHDVIQTSDNQWAYTTHSGATTTHTHETFTGGPGTTSFWHGCLLHGTLPVTKDEPRISLRYIFEKGNSRSHAMIDGINENMTGAKSLPSMIDSIKSKDQETRAISKLLDDDALVL